MTRLQYPRHTPDKIPVLSEKTEFPLSYSQRRLWYFDQITPDTATHSVRSQFRIRGSVDLQALGEAVRRVVERQAALRLVFDETEAGPVQRIAEPVRITIERFETESEADALEQLRREAGRPFRLGPDVPPFRVVLISIDPRDHWLLIASHHILTDGWSLSLTLRELSALYNHIVGGAPLELPDLPIRYVDYAAWELDRAEEPEVQQQVRLWAEALAGAPPVLPLPVDRARRGRASSAAHQIHFEIRPDRWTAIGSLCRTLRVTPFAVYVAAWTATLYRNGAGEDIVVGAPFSGRNRGEFENLVGFFATTLGIRLQFSSKDSFASLAKLVWQESRKALRRQEAPFEKIVESLHACRVPGSTPIFQTTVAYLAAQIDELDLVNVTAEYLAADSQDTDFDSLLSIDESAGTARGELKLRADLFDQSTANRLVTCFLRILEDACADPDRPLDQLRIQTADEQRREIESSSGLQTSIPAEPVHRLFEKQALASPDATAVVEGHSQLSYAELNSRANRICNALRGAGVEPGAIVALRLDRSADLIAAMLGVWKAGCCYLPLDAEEPPVRLAAILRNALPDCIVTRTGATGEETWGESRLLLLEEALAGNADDEASFPSAPEAAAYVMFTSGSTGEPKGVVAPHRAIVRLLFGTDYARFAPDEVFLHMASPAFDASTFEIWGALLHGGTCVVVPERRLSAARIGEVVQANKVTTAWLTSSLFNVVIDEEPHAFSSLRRLLIGGEALSVPHVRKALELLPGVRIINGYGPTECTTFALCHPIPDDLPPDFPSVPVGRPIANTEAYILDNRLEPVPTGIPGELYLGGPGLAVGYLNDPELTQSRFIPNPFNTDSEARLYRTGDWARRLPDGTVELLGRLDDQVKIRGFRIELGEIEYHLMADSRIAQAVAVVREETAAGKRVVAYVTPAADEQVNEQDLLAQLGPKLPHFMIPARLVVLESLPLNANGKVDRKALPEPPRRETDASPQSPADELERMILSIWELTFQTEGIGLDDNFFDLGGHSLLAARVTSRISKRLGRAISLAALFEAPTPRSLAELIRRRGSVDSVLAPVQPNGSLPPLLVQAEGPMYRWLAASLGKDRPLLAFNLSEKDFEQLGAQRTLERMAALLADKVSPHLPKGPYVMGGFCLRGLLAYATARQLAQRGVGPSMVILFDPSDPEALDGRADPLHPKHLVKRTWVHLNKLRRIPVRGSLAYLAGRIGALGNRRTQAPLRAQKRRQHLQPERVLDDLETIEMAACGYRLRPIDVPVAIVVPTETSPDRPERLRATWERLLGSRVTFHRADGSHTSMFREPHVHDLASLLTKILPSGVNG